MTKNPKYLVLFNLETDLESKVLAASHDWVSAFSENFERVWVFSTHVGRTAFPPNVTVTEIGGGSIPAKILAVGRLLRTIPFLFLNRNKLIVFYHMTTYPAIILGPAIRAMGIKQGLWYSHSVPSLTFRLATFFVNRLFSSSPDSLPIDSPKALFIGHGLNVERFRTPTDSGIRRVKSVVSVGRYARIKKFENMLELAKTFPLFEFAILGPEGETDYKRNLNQQYALNSPNIHLQSDVPYRDIPSTLRGFRYFYSGTPKSVDKAAIEAAMSGCFILTQNEATLKVTGMEMIWGRLGMKCPIEIADQLVQLEANEDKHTVLEAQLSLTAMSNNDVTRLTLRVMESLI
jgi:glycosyltransferase involved in cell wall biosynthesis